MAAKPEALLLCYQHSSAQQLHGTHQLCMIKQNSICKLPLALE